MRFSVIIPTHRPRYLREAAESVIDQVYEDWELVIQEGGLGNGYEQIADYAEMNDKVRYFYSKDRGVADALNKALEQANGDIFLWLSDDDVLMPHTLAEIALHLHGRKWGYGLVEIFDGDRVISYAGEKTDYLSLRTKNHVRQPLVFWTREAWNKIGCFNQGLDLITGYDYWLRLMDQYPEFAFIKGVLARYRLHPNQTSKKNPQEIRKQIDMLKEQLELE
jgi:glycosyltransferase involved in cell wall biosynthesis